jgi:hypothetical protein
VKREPRSGVVEGRGVSAGDAAKTLSEMTQAVHRLALALGVPASLLPGAESYDRLEVNTQVAATPLRALDATLLEDTFTLFGEDLMLSLEVAGLNPDHEPVVMELPAARGASAALRDFQSALRDVLASEGDSARVDVRLSAEKRRASELASALVAAREGFAGSAQMLAATGIIVFFKAQAWEERLRVASLPDWERLGLLGSEKRGVVLLCDVAGSLAGTGLDVAGIAGGALPAWAVLTRDDWAMFTRHMEAALALRNDQVRWAGAPAALPEHLGLRTVAPGMPATVRRLAAMRAELATLGLAQEVQGEITQRLVARFAGTRPATCEIPFAEADAMSDMRPLVALAEWAYQDATEARLSIAREALASELPSGQAVDASALVVAAAPALEAARANLALYLRGNVAAYFQAREAARDTVARYATSVRVAVSELTGDLVDNLYRTIGALAFGGLAWLLQPAGSIWVLRVACVVYAAYMLFMLVVVLRERSERFAMERAALESQLGAMAELTQGERGRLREPEVTADAHFLRYWRLARIIYAGLGALATLGCVLLFTPLAAALVQAHGGR